MAPPTIALLQGLARFDAVDAALSAARARKLDGSAELLTAQLSPGVRVVIAPNPGPLTGPGTNTYIVGPAPACVIDPAVADAAFLDALLHHAREVGVILVTHRHRDHVGGAAALAARTGAPVRAWSDAWAGGAAVAALGDSESVGSGGTTLRAVHTPGHARDHLCFLLESERALFSGDVVLGEGTPVIDPPEGDMRAYLDSLRRLATLDLRRIYPGHFRPLERPQEVFTGYLEHRTARERRILAAVDPAASLEEVVARVYDDTDPSLHDLAARSALAHLEKLQADGRVRRRADECGGAVWVKETRTGLTTET